MSWDQGSLFEESRDGDADFSAYFASADEDGGGGGGTPIPAPSIPSARSSPSGVVGLGGGGGGGAGTPRMSPGFPLALSGEVPRTPEFIRSGNAFAPPPTPATPAALSSLPPRMSPGFPLALSGEAPRTPEFIRSGNAFAPPPTPATPAALSSLPPPVMNDFNFGTGTPRGRRSLFSPSIDLDLGSVPSQPLPLQFGSDFNLGTTGTSQHVPLLARNDFNFGTPTPNHSRFPAGIPMNYRTVPSSPSTLPTLPSGNDLSLGSATQPSLFPPAAGNESNFGSSPSPLQLPTGNVSISNLKNEFMSPAPLSTPVSSDGFIFKTPAPPPLRGNRREPTPSTSRTATTMTSISGRRTPGTVLPPPTPSTCRTTIDSVDSNTMLAIVEGRGQARGEMGIACINLNTPTLILCQFTDTQSYVKVISKINVFRPSEILMPGTSCDRANPSQLLLQLQKEVSNIKIVPIQRRMFNEGTGLQRINSLVAEEYASVIHLITNKYYCLSASAALLKYAELSHSFLFSAKTLKVEFQGPEQTCMIDHITARHLELLQNNQRAGSPHSLLGIVNGCKTPIGARLLRMSILQPSCDVAQINTRLDCVQELMNKGEMLYGVQDILGRAPVDFEHVLASLTQIPKLDNSRITEQRINHTIVLKYTLEQVPGLIQVLANAENEYFQTIKADLSSPVFGGILARIKTVVQDEAQWQKGSVNMQRQRCFAVKAAADPILDVTRRAYCEIIQEVNDYIQHLGEELRLPLRLANSNQRGHYIQFVLRNGAIEPPDLGDVALQVRKRGNSVTFTTETLISIDHRAQVMLKEIERISGVVISALITGIRCDISPLFKISEALGNLDLIYSLANYALTTPGTVRPTFSSSETSITMGRHPILDLISVDRAVPNNAFLSDKVNFALITGPNMSGKTTCIKQVATLQILAQIGSFVPAGTACFRIARNILSRLGTGDNIDENASSFGLELAEMNFILQNVCDNSLIIIDELGRATSVEEGAAMSWAIAEELLKTKAFVLFATHHLFLTKMESMYLNVLNYTMETEEWRPDSGQDDGAAAGSSVSSCKLKYTHVMKRGVTDVQYYGLKLAMNTSYPPHIIRNAISYAESIVQNRGAGNPTNSVNQEMEVRRLKYLLAQQLFIAADSVGEDDDEEKLREYLKTLQSEFRAKLAASGCTVNNENP